ncbi:hypothetical protein LCGC14_0451600 [marine sediment metagenome]|uniref:PDZ domain-containing protein n=1 Tax=marine sediment metagenome TaxID=412755 RepID=A0A0F9T0Z1_9ZZZZ|nr:hypothetical protein [Phycisphaerae bacterium]HDZ43190.1 hypothetical protein [Phycisphaerae bacterium]
MELAVLTIQGVWGQYVGPLLMFAIGLGAVIFVHELGHFIVARWVGIHVETFALGVGPRLFGLRRGGTDYSVRLIPLGGYVKMAGQEDVAPLKEGDTDPGSFANKTVGQRFAVIAAGVVMNVIFASIVFVVIGLIGIQFPAPVIGGVEPGFPAAQAKIIWQDDGDPNTPDESVGLKPGDRILTLNGRRIHQFGKLQFAAILAPRGRIFEMTIRRTAGDKTRVGTATMGLIKGDHPGTETKVFRFGISPATEPIFGVNEDVIVTEDGLNEGERVLAVNDQPIEHAWDLRDIEADLDGRPVTVTVRPTDDNEQEDQAPDATRTVVVRPKLLAANKPYRVVFLADGSTVRATSVKKVADKDEKDDPSDKPSQVRLMLVDGGERIVAEKDIVHTDRSIDVLGMAPRLLFEGLTKGHPAAKAGLKGGDVVVSYGDRSTPTLAELRAINREFVDRGTQIVVFRNGRTQSPIDIRPRKKQGKPQIGALVMSDQEHLVVAHVRKRSPADAAGVARGCIIEKVNDLPVATWPELIRALTALKGKPITLHGRNGSQPFKADFGILAAGDFRPQDYRYKLFATRPFRMLKTTIRNTNPLQALAWGIEEVRYNVVMAYANLRALLQGTVSTKELRGPIGIADIAVQVARQGAIRFVYFMSMISVMLAVINFLPLPVLDGGHAVFLLIEKIRGRPLSVKIMNAVQIGGLVLLLGLVLIVTWRDVERVVESFM